MRSRLLFLGTAIAVVLGVLVSVGAAQRLPSWTPSRTADGQPDLQGVWADNTITPFERPEELAGRAFLTDEQLTTLKERAARLFSGSGDIAPGDELFLTLLRNPAEHRSTARATGDYNQVWLDDGLVFDTRTSQVVDPADGRLPALTAEGKRKQELAVEARVHSTDGPENRAPQERCLTFGTARVGPLMARNNSFHQIIQTSRYVVVSSEMIHEARVVPVDSRPHLPGHLRFWNGDARARWDGATLVIDSTNFSSHLTFRQKAGMPVSGEHVHLIERLVPVAADTLRYEVTVDDPTTWTRPWTAATMWKRSTERMFEYACHEANYAMADMLRGARAEEAVAKKP
jgi:hypothetical protein